MRREHEAQLGHPPAERGLGLEQVGVQAGFGQVDGGAHAADTPADDQDAARRRPVHPIRRALQLLLQPFPGTTFVAHRSVGHLDRTAH